MRSPLYYKEHDCGQIMTSNRRRDTYWYGRNGVRYDRSESTFYIQHHCPKCDIWIDEATDSEWRPEGESLDLGTHV